MKRLKMLCCLLSICVLFSMFLSGCGTNADNTDTNRLEKIYGVPGNVYEIIVDKETGIMYIGGYKTGICVMVDEDGKPLKYHGE